MHSFHYKLYPMMVCIWLSFGFCTAVAYCVEGIREGYRINLKDILVMIGLTVLGPLIITFVLFIACIKTKMR